ncbi:MAG: hypothetical protein RI953_3049 [Pseudomonadota bacterium]|jgi:hypothetical protein
MKIAISALVVLFSIAAEACRPSSESESGTASAKAGVVVKQSRGPCVAQFDGSTFTVAFKQDYHGNRGRERWDAEELTGYSYGDKNNPSLSIQWCRVLDGQKKCSNLDSGDSIFQTWWKDLTGQGKNKLVFELFPEKTPYEMKITLGSSVHIQKCPQWDDKK